MTDEKSGKKRRRKDKNSPPPSVEVTTRNQAVYSIYRRFIPVTLLSLGAAATSLLAAFSVWSVKSPPQYVQIQESGMLVSPRPLSENSVSHGVLGDFGLSAIRALNNYDYINWRTQLQSATAFFSPRAWGDYQKAYEEARTIEAVTKRKMVVSVEPTGPVQIPKEGVISATGEYAWQVEVPVKVTYIPHDSQLASANVQEGRVRMMISRVPLEVSPRGYAIQSYVFKVEK